jgi:hypothetical protein
MSVAMQNGRPQPQHRKQLSDQLDRFDEILDGLADGLNGAIADAAREGTRLAVKDAIVEILTNPTLRAAIQTGVPQPTPTPVASPRSAWAKLKDLLRWARAAVVAAVRQARTAVRNKVRAVRRILLKRAVVVTAAAGLALGAGAYYSAPHAGAVFSAAAGAVVAVAVRVALWVRDALRTILPV